MSVRSCLAVACILCGVSLCAQPVPQFKAYPASERYRGPNAPLVLTQNDREFRARLRAASKDKPNFAGHYIVTAWGCGAECLMGAAIDANTGKVLWFPHSICCWYTPGARENDVMPLQYHLDSNLIIFTGMRNEEGENANHYYAMKSGAFVYIKSIGRGKE